LGDDFEGGGEVAEARGGGEDEVALGDDFEGGGEVGDAKGDAAFQALRL